MSLADATKRRCSAITWFHDGPVRWLVLGFRSLGAGKEARHKEAGAHPQEKTGSSSLLVPMHLLRLAPHAAAQCSCSLYTRGPLPLHSKGSGSSTPRCSERDPQESSPACEEGGHARVQGVQHEAGIAQRDASEVAGAVGRHSQPGTARARATQNALGGWVQS